MASAKRVTLQTLADRLGVSRTTVSNAYNRPDQLAADLRQKILDAAAELGYRGPSATGRMLRTGRIGTIGLLFTEDLQYVFADPNTTLFMRGVAETSALAGTGLTLLPVPARMPLEQTALPTAPVDGYLVFSVADGHPALAVVLNSSLPVVIVDEPDLGSRTSFVGIGDREGARLAATHLGSLGHTQVVVLVDRLSDEPRGGPVGPDALAGAVIRVARERIAGYHEGFLAAGLDAGSVPIWEAGRNDQETGRAATTALLKALPNTTALLCSTDQVALGALEAARAVGRMIPGDLSIVGFDDIPQAAATEPALTTIRQPLVDKGRLAAELLLDQIRYGLPKRVELPVELVVRGSTGPAPN